MKQTRLYGSIKQGLAIARLPIIGRRRCLLTQLLNFLAGFPVYDAGAGLVVDEVWVSSHILAGRPR
jgi:hypothetical protein